MMRRYKLTDDQVNQIEELLSSDEGQQGRLWKDYCKIINGMFQILRSRAPLAGTCPNATAAGRPSATVFRHWQHDDTFDRILNQLQLNLGKEGKIDWELFCIDGTNVQATRAAGTPKKGPR